MPQMTADGSCGFDMYADGEYCGTFAPKITYDTPFLANFSAEGGYEAIIDLKSKKMRDIIINFPLYEAFSSANTYWLAYSSPITKSYVKVSSTSFLL